MKNRNEIEIYEIKKSSKLTIGGSYQLYFYLWTLKKSNIDAKGYMVYPKEKKKELIELNNEIIEELNDITQGIIEIANLEKPPKPINKPYCKKCTYYELCRIWEDDIIKQPLNINSNGILYRKDNTLKYTNKEVDKTIPIHAINEINCYGKVSLKSEQSHYYKMKK